MKQNKVAILSLTWCQLFFNKKQVHQYKPDAPVYDVFNKNAK